MAEGDTGALLRALNTICSDGYQIIEEAELLHASAALHEPLAALMSRLHAQGYIDVRYAEDGVYCLRLLAPGRHYAEDRARAFVRARRNARRRLAALFAAAFSGAFLATLLALGLFLLLWGGKGGA